MKKARREPPTAPASPETPVVAPDTAALPSMPKNRAAFLTGVYAYLPCPERVYAPLMEIAGGLPSSHLLLLDNALARFLEYETELGYLPRLLEKWQLMGMDEIEMRDCREGDRLRDTAEELLEFMKRRVRAISEHLWPGKSDLRDWYLAGLAVGNLYDHVVRLERGWDETAGACGASEMPSAFPGHGVSRAQGAGLLPLSISGEIHDELLCPPDQRCRQ